LSLSLLILLSFGVSNYAFSQQNQPKPFTQTSFAEPILKVFPTSKGYSVIETSSNKSVYNDVNASKAIQFAIDKARSGDVLILSGCYHITKPIYIKSHVNLIGQGRGTELRLGDTNKEVIIFKSTDNSTLGHMAISVGSSVEPHSTGISIVNSTEISIKEVLIVGFKDYGINASASAGISIKGSHMIGNEQGNIHFSNLKPGQKGNKIINTLFLWGGKGVFCEGSSNVTINSCVVQQIYGVPFELEGENITISKNRTFYAESDIADVIIKGSNINVSNNNFCWGRGNGILVDGAKKVLITENQIIDHGTPPGNGIYKSGILLRNKSHDVEILGNAIFNWDDWTQGPMLCGIEERPGCKDNHFAYNTIHFYQKQAILSRGTGTLVQNNISDPGNGDLKAMPDFEEFRGTIKDFIDEELLNIGMTYWGGNDFIVSTDGKIINVRSVINQEIVFKTKDAAQAIQWAIDKCSPYGGSIELEAGNYVIEKTIFVRKNIWLKGQGEKTILYAKNSSDMGACIRMENAPQARVSDMKLVQAGNVPTGIEICKSTTGKVVNVEIDGFKNYGVDFIQELPGNINRGKVTSSLVEVRECTIANSGVNINIPRNGGYVGRMVPNLISGNIIIGGGTGIVCKAICTALIDNIIVNTKGTGIVLDENSILTTGNILYRCGGSAVAAFDGKQYFHFHLAYDRQDNNNNKECNITQNFIVEPRGHGIEVSEQWGTVSGNVIVNSGFGNGQRYGIWLHEDSESYCVYKNRIYNLDNSYPMQYGIREAGLNNIIAENTISGFRNQGVLSKGDKTVIKENTTKNKSTNIGKEWKFDNKVTTDMDYETIRNYIINKIGLDN